VDQLSWTVKEVKRRVTVFELLKLSSDTEGSIMKCFLCLRASQTSSKLLQTVSIASSLSFIVEAVATTVVVVVVVRARRKTSLFTILQCVTALAKYKVKH